VLNDISFTGYRFSEQVQDSLHDSPTLQTLVLYLVNFQSFDEYESFLGSLHSSSLCRLKIFDWDFCHAAFLVEIFQKHLLTDLYMMSVSFMEAGWKSIWQELPKCKTLDRLEFKSVEWWGSNKYRRCRS